MKGYIRTSCVLKIVFAILVVGVFVSWYLILQARPIYNYHKNTTSLVAVDSIRTDSLTGVYIDSVYKYLSHLDVIEERVDSLSNNYLSEVDLAVDKSNGWLAFWIGVITIVIGLSSFWQVYRQNQSDKDFFRLKKENEKDFHNFTINAKKEINARKKEIEEINNEINTELDNLRKTFRETKISSLMMCLSSFPDPQMTADTEDKKKQIFILMKNILSTYIEYIKNIESQEKDNQIDFEGVFMVLTNLKLAVVRTHGAYSDIHQNIRFSQIIKEITMINDDILNGEPITDLSSRLKNIASMLRGLIRLIE